MLPASGSGLDEQGWLASKLASQASTTLNTQDRLLRPCATNAHSWAKIIGELAVSDQVSCIDTVSVVEASQSLHIYHASPIPAMQRDATLAS